MSNARVGNIYVNRNQIGAVVESQPFGGEGLSGTGPKAGGPHYVARFGTGHVHRHDRRGRQCVADGFDRRIAQRKEWLPGPDSYRRPFD